MSEYKNQRENRRVEKAIKKESGSFIRLLLNSLTPLSVVIAGAFAAIFSINKYDRRDAELEYRNETYIDSLNKMELSLAHVERTSSLDTYLITTYSEARSIIRRDSLRIGELKKELGEMKRTYELLRSEQNADILSEDSSARQDRTTEILDSVKTEEWKRMYVKENIRSYWSSLTRLYLSMDDSSIYRGSIVNDVLLNGNTQKVLVIDSNSLRLYINTPGERGNDFRFYQEWDRGDLLGSYVEFHEQNYVDSLLSDLIESIR